MLTSQELVRAEFEPLVERFIGLPVSRCHRGYGSAILLDFGVLRPIHAPSPSERGECHVLIEWSWRVEGPRSIKFGSWSTDRRIDNKLSTLEGLKLSAAHIEGRMPELVLEFEGRTWLHSFSTVEGQPEWAFFLAPQGDWIHVVRGELERQIWIDD